MKDKIFLHADTLANVALAVIGLFQLAFLIAGYYLGRNYLRQHREKVKSENQEKYAIKIIEAFTELEMLINDLIVHKLEDSQAMEKMVPRHSFNEDVAFSMNRSWMVNKRFTTHRDKFLRLYKECRKNSFLLKDKKLDAKIHEVEMSVKGIARSFFQVFDSIEMYLYNLNGAKFEVEKIREIYQLAPKSMEDNKNLEVQNYHTSVQEVRNQLLQYIN